jgi:uncharacterized membrane protein
MSAKGFIGGVAVGAGLVYFLDPERGPERRARALGGVGKESRSVSHYGSRLGDIGGLEAANLRARRRGFEAEQLVRIAGGALALYGLVRRGAVGGLLKTIGAGLVASAVREEPRLRAPTGGERRRTVDIQKTIVVEAPVEQVYAFWSNYGNFPLFMSHVRDVQDLGASRSRWIVSGPGGLPVEWNAVLTERIPDTLLAWRSEPGSMLENAGVIRFAPEGAGTRIDLRFCYNPPAGRAGRAMADFFGADPRARVNEDLGRLKTLLESTVRSDIHGQEPGS